VGWLIVSALVPTFIHLAKVFVVNYNVPSGTVLDSFSFFNPNSLAVVNFTISSAQPVTNYFAVQPSGPNSGMSGKL
jgi:hypothetical protein